MLSKQYPESKAQYSEDRTSATLNGKTYSIEDRQDWGRKNLDINSKKVMLHCRVWSIEHLGQDPWPEDEKRLAEWRQEQENLIQKMDEEVSPSGNKSPTEDHNM